MIDEPRVVAPRWGAPAKAYFLLMLVPPAVLAVAAVPGVRPEPGVIPVLDDWVHLAGYLLAAGAAVWRIVRYAEQRLLWSIVAVALLLRTTGFAWTFFVLERAPVYPSFADLAWVLSALLLLAALLLVTHLYLPRHSRVRAVDALLGGVTAAAVFVALLHDSLRQLSGPQVPADVVVINLAYPVLDVALLVVVIGLLASTRGQLPMASTALCIGAVVFAVVDSVFLYQAVAGTFRPGGPLTVASLVGSMVIGVAGWLPSRHQRSRHPVADLVLPAVLVLTCVAVMGSDILMPVPALGVLLAAVGVVLAMVRAVLAFTVDRRVSDSVLAVKNAELEQFRSLVEASNDFIAIASTNGTVIYLNPAGRELVGLEPGTDVTTTTIADYLTEEGVVASIEVEQPAVIEHGSWQGESTLRDMRDGSATPVTINSFLVRHPATGDPWLLATVQRDVSERRAAETAARQLAEEREARLSHLIEAQEAERARIADDVHDDSVQALAVVDLQLGLLRSRLNGGDAETLEVLQQVRDSVGTATERLRHLLFDLDSPAQRGDLFSALEEAASVIFEGDTRWQVIGDREVDLPEAHRVVAHRMAKEAMVNIKKHAHATTVTIELRSVDGGVEVAVSDDGIGLDAAQVELRPGHRGLADMRDRATIAGGWVSVEGRKQQGSTVRIWLPASASADPA